MRSYVKNTISLADEIAKLDPSKIPGEKEIQEAVRKRLTKGHFSRADLRKEDALQNGDNVTVKVESTLPRFNKESVSFDLGGGLYDKVLESALLGKRIGDSGVVTTRDVEVKYVVLSARRSVIPEPTDAMVEEQGIENVHTVEEFTKFLGDQMRDFAWDDMVSDLCFRLSGQADIDLAQEDRDTLEAQTRADLMANMQKRGVEDPVKDFPEHYKSSYRVSGFEEFVKQQAGYRENSLRMQLALCSALGIAPEGEYDFFTGSKDWSELMNTVGEKVKEDIMRRKA